MTFSLQFSSSHKEVRTISSSLTIPPGKVRLPPNADHSNTQLQPKASPQSTTVPVRSLDCHLGFSNCRSTFIYFFVDLINFVLLRF